MKQEVFKVETCKKAKKSKDECKVRLSIQWEAEKCKGRQCNELNYEEKQ